MRTPLHGRPGFVASGLLFVGLIVAATGLVLAVSTQASTTRATQATTTMGRYATELAESSIDECMVDFTQFVSDKMRHRNVRQFFLAQAKKGIVAADAITDGTSWEFVGRLTNQLAQEQQLGINLSPVTVRPLYFAIVQNFGEVELSCHASFRMGGARQLYRRVTVKHYFVLDADGHTLRINPVASQVSVDRRADS
jgi:hypothetical protein